jgi:hypothetical protein
MRVLVPLYPQDEDLARDLALGRNEKFSRYGAMTYTYTDSFVAHWLGARGEIAVANHYRVPVDEAIHELHGDEGDDLLIHGRRCQVKATSYWDEPLLRVETHKQKMLERCEFYFCVVSIAYEPMAQLVGWASRREVLDAPLVRFGKAKHENYVLEEHELHECTQRSAA